MVAISSSQKKTAFAVVLLTLIAVGVMISGRGGFSGLRSDAFNNPSFMCTNQSLMSGEVRYSGAAATIQKLTAEKAGIQTKIQGWNADIRKNEASIKKLEREKAAAEKKERALEVAVKKQCTPRALPTCAAKKRELQNAKQNVNKIQNSLVSAKTQSNTLRTNIQSAESSVKLLEKQILEIQNFKEDYETCKRALTDNKPLDKLIFRSPTMSGEVQFSGLTGSQVLLYDFSMEFPSTPSTISGEVGGESVTIGSLSLNAVFPLDTISFKDWIIVYPLPGHHDGAVVFSCSYAKNEGTLKCSPRDGQDFVLRRGEAARGLQLYAVLDGVTGSGSFKIHGVTGIGHSIPLETEILTTSIKYNYGSTVLDLCNNITGIQTTVPAGTAQNSAGGCVCANGGTNPPTCTPIVTEPVCINLSVSPTSVTNGGGVTYTCSGSNATSYSIVGRRPDGSAFVISTSAAGAIILPISPLGTYTVSCFINGQTTTTTACQKTVTNTTPTSVPSATCDSLIFTRTSGSNWAYNCGGTNVTSYSIVARRPDGNIVAAAINGSGILTLPTSPIGTYNIACFVNGQTTTTTACQKTISTEPICTHLSVGPTNLKDGGDVTYNCAGDNVTNYSLQLTGPDGTILQTLTAPTGTVRIPTRPTGNYTAKCFVNNQTSTPDYCTKTIINDVQSESYLTTSLDQSTPLSGPILDNTAEHSLAIFRLAASEVEDISISSIKITDYGYNNANVIASYKLYSGATLLSTVAPNGAGDAEFFLADGTLTIPANDYKLVTVKAVIRDIDGVTFKNGDTIRAGIGAGGSVNGVGKTSGKVFWSWPSSVAGNSMTAYEAYPIVAFAPDAGIGSTITLNQNQLIAKIMVSNPGNKVVTSAVGFKNFLSVKVKTVGDNSDLNSEILTLKDQDGITLDTNNDTITSASGITRVGFDINSLTIPALGTKYLYIYADTSDLEDNGDQIQVWIDDDILNLNFGINGTGTHSIGDIMFRGNTYGPVLSRSF